MPISESAIALAPLIAGEKVTVMRRSPFCSTIADQREIDRVAAPADLLLQLRLFVVHLGHPLRRHGAVRPQTEGFFAEVFRLRIETEFEV